MTALKNCDGCNKLCREAELIEASDDTQHDGCMLCVDCDLKSVEAALRAYHGGIGDPLAEMFS